MKIYNNDFIGIIGLTVSLFENENYKIKFKFQNTDKKEVIALSFYLANIMAYENNKSGYKRFNYNFNITKDGNEFNIVLTDIAGMKNGFFQCRGKGVIYMIENGIEIFYIESIHRASKKLSYQVLVEDLADNERIVKMINLSNNEIMECYLVDNNFEILDADNNNLTNKGFKTLFKSK